MDREFVDTFKPFGAKFPAMEELILHNYKWTHSQGEFEQIRDFSILRKLSLQTEMLGFFKSAPFNQLQQLAARNVQLKNLLRGSNASTLIKAPALVQSYLF
jgi:hypothetical protein